MKIKLLVARAGTDFSQTVGEIIDVSDDEGHRMILAEQAEPYTPATLVQFAKQQSFVEKAVKKIFGEKAVKDA